MIRSESGDELFFFLSDCAEVTMSPSVSTQEYVFDINASLSEIITVFWHTDKKGLCY